MGAERKEGGREGKRSVHVCVCMSPTVDLSKETQRRARAETKKKTRKVEKEAGQPEEGSTSTRHDDNSNHNGSRTDERMEKKETHKEGRGRGLSEVVPVPLAPLRKTRTETRKTAGEGWWRCFCNASKYEQQNPSHCQRG